VRIAIVSAVLFISGVSALVFETLWLRLSGLVFGNSVWAAALILSSFMAGLALGGLIAASLDVRRRLRQPLRLYALLELIIAILGCTIVFAIPLLGEWLRPLFQTLWNHDSILNGLRFLLSFLILVIPTTAMGLTLPILLADPGLRRANFARVVSLLYGCNTLGAVFGALIGEAYLVRLFGLRGTAFAAAGLNLLAALVAFTLAQSRNAISEEVADEPPPLARNFPAIAPGRLLAVSFGSGFVLLSLEVVWFRFLRLYVASSSTAFAVMLAVVLTGIGLGGIAASAVYRRGARPGASLSILLLLSSIVTLLCYFCFRISFLPRPDFYLDTWREIGALSLLLMFPAAFLSGVLFPSITAAVQEGGRDRTNSAGLAILFNTTGAAIGPLLTTFLFLPGMGFQRTLILCAVAYVILALIAGEPGSWSVTRVRGVAAWILAAGAAILIFLFPRGRDETHFAHARQPFEQDGSRLVKKIEGNSDTFQLLRRDLLGQPLYYRLLTNAFTMSDTRYQNQRYMRLFAYLPLTLRPESEDALLICFGCGMTADALLHDQHLKRLDIVDISKEVLDLAQDYVGPNYSNPLRDPRVTTYLQDGRFFLQASAGQYDVITGEPPPPKIAGTVNLYTEEFFRLMNARLKEGGIATFWLPINQLKVDEAKAILLAFHNAFPNASVWANSDYEWIMMGIKGPGRRLEKDEMRRWWNDPAARSDLARIGVETPEQFPALFLMDAPDIESLTSGTLPLTDFFPKRLSDTAANPAEVDRFAMEYMPAAGSLRRFRASELMTRLWPAPGDTVDPYFVLRATRYLSETRDTNRMAELDTYLRKYSVQTPVLEVLGSDPLRVSIVREVARSTAAAPKEALPDLTAGALAQHDFEGASRFLELERSQGSATRGDLLLLAYVYCMGGHVDKAEAAAATLGPDRSDRLTDWLWGNLQAEFGFRPPSN
jgi:predicted membrane-bound spermidine synthase